MSNKPIIDNNNEIIKGISKKHAWEKYVSRPQTYKEFMWENKTRIEAGIIIDALDITNMSNPFHKQRVSKLKKIWDTTFKQAIDIEIHTIYDENGNRYLIDKNIGILAKLE